MEVVNLAEKFDQFSDHWAPRIIGELNDQQVKIAKVKGEFVWHDHAQEDEMFLIIKGKLRIEFRGSFRELSEGELLIVPRGVEHKPIAEDEVWLMLFEPSKTKHTGEVNHALTQKEAKHI